MITVIWMCLWPVCCSICNYIDAKKRKIEGRVVSEEISDMVGVIQLFIWGIGLIICLAVSI